MAQKGSDFVTRPSAYGHPSDGTLEYTKHSSASIFTRVRITMMIDTILPTSRIPISVEQQPNGQWFAQVLGWTDCQAEATSREAAIVGIQQTLNDRLTLMDVVFIDLPTPPAEDPWMKHAGMFKDEPLFDQVLEEIATYRRELDADRPELHTDI
jgi:hypothetical protein